jgi:ectoine hydroxylase-related dioxygenase (phytanoyl-CoA dioxygenase family)
MKEDGYLLLRGILDKDLILKARHELLLKMAVNNQIDDDYLIGEGVNPSLKTEIDRTSYREGRAVRQLVHQGKMTEFYEIFFGKKVQAFDFIWVRIVGVGVSTGCHYDWVYMGRGSKNLHTSWTPLANVPKVEGSLAILRGSHKFGGLINTYGSIDVDDDKTNKKYGGWYTQNPVEVQEKFGGKWLTTDFKMGDLIVFSMHTMHCSLDNKSTNNRIRLSLDTRYQPADDEADERWIGGTPIAHGAEAKRR